MRERASQRLRAQAATPGGYWAGAHTTHRYWAGAHTTHRLRVHVVWIPKYRRRVLDEPVARRLTDRRGAAAPGL